jgi:hypothetical protein
MPQTTVLLIALAATLLCLPVEAFGASRLEQRPHVNLESPPRLVQASDDQLGAERKRSDAAAKRARAALEAQKPARDASEAPPRDSGNPRGDVKATICVAGC